MPELPEVETTRRGLAPVLRGRRIGAVRVRERRLRWPLPAGFEAALAGARVTGVGRRGKYLLIGTDRGTLLVHLGMSGSLRAVDPAEPPRPHDHVELVLDSGRCVRFNDPRRFGTLQLVRGDPAAHALLRGLGPEPLGAGFDADYLYARARGRRVAVKKFLMNAAIVVGVGNIYASEALFRAGIRPQRAAGRLTRAEAARLVAAVRRVLAAAIRVGGTTLRDYVNADGLPGYFRQKLYVYERAGQPCRRCGTPIRQRVQGQRSTYWCPSCQR
ncbi:MAG: bifunctional DNA-formamidopyrimidine glycosylase/DNA-(apurinic or apyrimidinic site) lyase [Proteobacteria bacterium]|nr:bifunctional DNA-formamidopyrimidine glycosylase/DNA-(apurinic or apyrimidinic site) lyase [Pseudomonadota bacterium]